MIVNGKESLSSMTRLESKALINQRGRNALTQSVRLACQARVLDDTEVLKHGVFKL